MVQRPYTVESLRRSSPDWPERMEMHRVTKDLFS